MSLKLPSELNIHGKRYKVLLVDELENDGEVDYKKREIYIKSDLSYADKKQTLFHEALHGVLHENSVTITSISEDMMDIIVNSIANWLTECKEIGLIIKRRKK